MSKRVQLSRRGLLAGIGAIPIAMARSTTAATLPAAFAERVESDRARVKIRDVQVMVMQGPGRNYTLVRVVSDAGPYGIAEAYGTPGVGVKEQILALRPWLIGKNPLEIDKLYTQMGEGSSNLSGTRTDGSAHNMMRAVSGIEMALWDLAGKILEVPTAFLLGGRFRDKVRVYDHAAPRNMLDKASCADWAAQAKTHKSGFTCHKYGLQNSDPTTDQARDVSNRVLTTKELIGVRQGFENCRDAIGWDHDLMVHCHWEYDLRTSIQIADAVESSKPVWLEDPLGVDYTDSWKRLCESSKVPICMGENLTRREGFLPFILNQGSDILHPDLRNSVGLGIELNPDVVRAHLGPGETWWG
jgi:L-alanine-DL-glutamate epimerase-like enolase superfamily enzyme